MKTERKYGKTGSGLECQPARTVVIHGASVGYAMRARCVGSLLVEWLGGVMADVLQSITCRRRLRPCS